MPAHQRNSSPFSFEKPDSDMMLEDVQNKQHSDEHLSSTSIEDEVSEEASDDASSAVKSGVSDTEAEDTDIEDAFLNFSDLQMDIGGDNSTDSVDLGPTKAQDEAMSPEQPERESDMALPPWLMTPVIKKKAMVEENDESFRTRDFDRDYIDSDSDGEGSPRHDKLLRDVQEELIQVDERVRQELSSRGISLDIEGTELDDISLSEFSDLTAGNQSYILDLATQKEARQHALKEEVYEEALDLYTQAKKEGHRGEAFFLLLVSECKKKLYASKVKHYKLQDERLDKALDEELQLREGLKETEDAASRVAKPGARRSRLDRVVELRKSENLEMMIHSGSKIAIGMNEEGDYDWGEGDSSSDENELPENSKVPRKKRDKSKGKTTKKSNRSKRKDKSEDAVKKKKKTKKVIGDTAKSDDPDRKKKKHSRKKSKATKEESSMKKKKEKRKKEKHVDDAEVQNLDGEVVTPATETGKRSKRNGLVESVPRESSGNSGTSNGLPLAEIEGSSSSNKVTMAGSPGTDVGGKSAISSDGAKLKKSTERSLRKERTNGALKEKSSSDRKKTTKEKRELSKLRTRRVLLGSEGLTPDKKSQNLADEDDRQAERSSLAHNSSAVQNPDRRLDKRSMSVPFAFRNGCTESIGEKQNQPQTKESSERKSRLPKIMNAMFRRPSSDAISLSKQNSRFSKR